MITFFEKYGNFYIKFLTNRNREIAIDIFYCLK